MSLTREQIAEGIGNAFATMFWQVIKDELPKSFTWEKLFENNRQEVRDKLSLYYIEVPTGEELVRLQDIAEEAFKQGCEKIKQDNS